MQITTKTIITSFDNKEFDTPEQCTEYENALLEKMRKEKAEKEAREAFEKLIITPIISPLAFNTEDADIYIMEVKNKADKELIAHHLPNGSWIDTTYLECDLDTIIEQYGYPCRVCYYESDTYANVFDYNRFIRELSEALNKALIPSRNAK